MAILVLSIHFLNTQPVVVSVSFPVGYSGPIDPIAGDIPHQFVVEKEDGLDLLLLEK